jgi:hypothetical protein
MGHSTIETTKNIYGHLFAQDRTAVLSALNQAVSRLHAYESDEPGTGAEGRALSPDFAQEASSPTSYRANALAAVALEGSDLGGRART